MLGLFFAALCAVGLYRTWRPHRFGRHRFGSPGVRVDWLVRRLGANPEQEAAIRQSADEIQRAFGSVDPWARMASIASALTAQAVDRDKLRAELDEPKPGMLAEAVVSSVERLREKLTDSQRQTIAAMMQGRRGWACR